MNPERHDSNESRGEAETRGEFMLERYKHVLTEQRALDTNTQASFTLFQSITTVALGAVSLVVLRSDDWSLTVEASRGVVKTAALLIVLTGASSLANMVGNMFSWFDLRKEEQRFTRTFAIHADREGPSFRNLWRWKESYSALMVALWTIAIAWLLLDPYLGLLDAAQ